MASNMSQYLAKAILDATIRGVSYTFPSTVWVALFTSSTNEALLDAGTITNEVSGTGYARLEKTTGDFNAATLASPSVITNNGNFTWAQVTVDDWGTVGYVAVMDSNIGGTDKVLFSGAISTPKLMTVDDSFQFLDTDLVLSLT